MFVYIFLVFLAFFLWYYLLKKEPQWCSVIPGKPSLPFVGNAFQIDPSHPHITYYNWAKEIGSIFKVHLFGQIQVIANDYESVYEIMVKKTNEYAGRVSMYRTREISCGNSNIGLMDFCPKQKLMKKLCMTGVRLGQGSDGDIERAALECATDLIEKLRDNNGKPVDVREDLRMAILKVIVTLSFGRKLADDDPRLALLSELEKSFMASVTWAGEGIAMDFMPWIRIFGGKTVRYIKRCQELQQTVLADMLQETRKSRQNGGADRCILDPLLVRHEAKPGESPFNDTNILMAAGDMIVAGLVTTSILLYHMVNLMLHYPAVLKKAQQEVDDQVGSNRPVMLEDRASMPYCQAVIFESLRQFSHGPFAMPHKAMEDTTLGKYAIPKGTQVLTNLWAVHHDETFWEDPYGFKPERFLDTDGQLVGPDHENRKRLLAFGAGRRVCPGEILALIRVFIFYTNLVKSFNFRAPENTKLASCDPRSKEFGVGAVIDPPSFKVCLIPR